MSQSRKSTTEAAPLSFKTNGEASQMFRPSSNKIGWVHAQANKPGALFDLTVKDIHGYVVLYKQDCGNETDRFGELINQEVMMGQEIEVTVDNIRNAESIDLFLN